MADEELYRALGRIEGKIDCLIELPERIDKIDTRLREVEKRAVINGAVAGGIVGIGITLLEAKLKSIFGIDIGDGA